METNQSFGGPLRIGDKAPNFTARSTSGEINLADYKGRWLVLFSHPADFTPVCTTEFIAFAKAAPQFEKMDCALMALSVDSLFSHLAWVRAIKDAFDIEVRFPIVEDPTLVIGRAYGMVSADAHDASAVRTSFFIDPEGTIRAMTCYPASIGRSVDEMLRMVAALQAADGKSALAPEGWQKGDALLRQPEGTLESVFASKDATSWFFQHEAGGETE